MKLFRSIAKRLIKYCMDDNITVYAAQASFFIVISAIPMIMLMVPLIQYLLPAKGTIISEVTAAIVPEASGLRSFLMEILDDVYTNSTGVIVSFSAITALWAASKGIYALQEGLNRLGHIKASANFFVRRGKSILYTIAFILIILFAVIFIMFGEAVRDLALTWFPDAPYLSLIITLLRSIIAFEIFLHFFILIYATLPSGRTYFTNKIPSAIFTAIGWMIFSYAYAFYINHFAGNSYIYGSLTALILLMLWLYFCMCIFFIGAELSKIILTRSKDKIFSIHIAGDVLMDAYGEDYVKITRGRVKYDADMYPPGYVEALKAEQDAQDRPEEWMEV